MPATVEEAAELVPHPGSAVWRHAGDARLLATAGYALLLQVSHPTVGAGVSEHSDFKADPWGRLLRTLDYTYDTRQPSGRRIVNGGTSIVVPTAVYPTGYQVAVTGARVVSRRCAPDLVLRADRPGVYAVSQEPLPVLHPGMVISSCDPASRPEGAR